MENKTVKVLINENRYVTPYKIYQLLQYFKLGMIFDIITIAL